MCSCSHQRVLTRAVSALMAVGLQAVTHNLPFSQHEDASSNSLFNLFDLARASICFVSLCLPEWNWVCWFVAVSWRYSKWDFVSVISFSLDPDGSVYSHGFIEEPEYLTPGWTPAHLDVSALWLDWCRFDLTHLCVFVLLQWQTDVHRGASL